ncbi:sensor histidine kinase [Staphylococcus borealis]|uniref:sensor histidine kinase n=1 Tax=Staphylococcus borealis TaxID=2742203 RepID=UPI000FED560B|nr:HAMP domain-containing sensor histidine kinase [Staphylococcus borealis]MDM7882890.1 HAMP domain-containing sensor histidine kinase [Staphylococcus borealis]RIO92709.1 sensor histidine kinase [Staphylococcus haemolyticus]
MFKSLYTRIAIYTITVILFSALVSFLFANIYYHFNLKAHNDTKIMRTLKEARQFHASSNQSNSQAYFKHLGDMNYQIMIVDRAHHKTFYGEPFRQDTISNAAINQVLQGEDYHGIKNKPFELFVTGFFDNETDNTVGVRFTQNHQPLAVFMRPDIGETFSEFRTFLSVLLICLLSISITLVIASTYSIIKPIKTLKQATERLIHGDFDTPIYQSRHDEIGTLQYRFDAMRQALKQVDDMRQHFVQNVSHEIKTPLTHIQRLLTELQFTATQEKRQTYIDEIHDEVTRLSNLTKELLLLSELDNANHLRFDDHIHITTMIKEIIRHEQFELDNKDLMLLSDLSDVYFQGNSRLLHQAFSNLIQNAIKYASIGGTVEVSLSHEHNDSILFSVNNEGNTIPSETQSHIFERFYKLNEQDNSNGLGLAITQSIIKLHQGEISVSSDVQRGTTFTIRLTSNL